MKAVCYSYRLSCVVIKAKDTRYLSAFCQYFGQSTDLFFRQLVIIAKTFD